MVTLNAVAREQRETSDSHATPPRFRWALCFTLCLFACESYTPAKRSAIYEACCEDQGTCVPSPFVPAGDVVKVGQDICEDKLLCVPKGLAERPDTYLADTCRSFGLAEGRCLPSCLPAVSEQMERLQQDGCPDSTMCVPCTDPLTGESTGSCDLGGDQGPTEPPTFFAFCCGEKGRCIPQAIVGDDMASSFSADTCDNATSSLCVPQAWVDDRTAIPPTCASWDDAEGRCLSVCLPEVQLRGQQLRADTCDENSRCVPCYDPITGDPTSACKVGDDVPQEPPQKFASCCSDVGSCVPVAAVPADERSRLSQDSCASADTLCVPREWAALDQGKPKDCNAYGGGAGRCLPLCLPEVANQADRLQRGSCDDTHLCVPCYDPISGENTGACTIGNDQAPTQPYLFDNCCGDRGRCVPSDAVNDMSREGLGPDTCTGDNDSLCVPSQWLVESPPVPATCAPYGDYEGRCLPDCLPGVVDKAGRLRQTSCLAGEKCAPCWDPLTGEGTGACTANGDEPGPVRTFTTCCGSLGACVPEDALEADDRSRLDGTECAALGGGMCAPQAWVTDDRASPMECRSLGGTVEGRCLPACLPDVHMRADKLLQENCPDANLCVPCFDPVTFASTRACNIGADAAHERPAGFDECADKQGWCVPNALIKAADRSRLPTDTCDGAAGKLCAPSDWVKNDRFVPATCSAPGDIEGRCLPDYLPDVKARSENLTTTGCADRQLCVPCFDPVSGESTNACTINGDQPKSGGATTYPQCCGSDGLCVPNEFIPAADSGQLGSSTCNAEQAMCVPRAWVGSERPAPTSCRGYDNAEGRCLPTCLPKVSSQADNLRRDSCPSTDLCVPCYDPLDGKDTGACTTTGDAPKEPAVVFPMCCESLGRCVPTDLVDSADRSRLDANTCTMGDHLCAPNNSLSNPSTAAPTCHGQLSAEGRCLPNCLPAVAARSGDLEQDVCAASTSCVPCYDPTNGEDTGACTQGGDTPKEEKKVFENCCGGSARCVPSGQVPEGDRSNLDKNSCNNPSDALCVPNDWVSKDRQAPSSCRAPGDLEGRCLLSCLPNVSKKKDQLRRSSCDSDELCAPCYDPLSGESTGSCNINGDAPKEDKKTYANCCGSNGTCVPPDMINGDRSALNKDSCSGDNLCVPQSSARGGRPDFKGCTVLFIAAGACVPKCFVGSNQDSSFLTSDGCNGDELCAPCNQLGSLNVPACN